MNKTSEVTTIQPLIENGVQRSWQGKSGPMYVSWVTLANGDQGEVNNATQGPHPDIRQGQSITYTLKNFTFQDGKTKTTISLVKPNTGKGKSYGKVDEKEKYPSFALRYATDFSVAMIGQGHTIGQSELFKQAETMLTWLNEKHKIQTGEGQQPPQQPSTQAPPTLKQQPQNSTNTLPWE